MDNSESDNSAIKQGDASNNGSQELNLDQNLKLKRGKNLLVKPEKDASSGSSLVDLCSNSDWFNPDRLNSAETKWQRDYKTQKSYVVQE